MEDKIHVDGSGTIRNFGALKPVAKTEDVENDCTR
jgi:hypothetical protein